MARINANIPDEVKKEVDRVADYMGIEQKAVVNIALVQFLSGLHLGKEKEIENASLQ